MTKSPLYHMGGQEWRTIWGRAVNLNHEPARPQDKQPLRDIKYKIIAWLANTTWLVHAVLGCRSVMGDHLRHGPIFFIQAHAQSEPLNSLICCTSLRSNGLPQTHPESSPPFQGAPCIPLAFPGKKKKKKKKRLYVACALKLIQVDINPEILSSTLTQDTWGRNMRALCQAKGGGGEKQQRVEDRERENTKRSPF